MVSRYLYAWFTALILSMLATRLVPLGNIIVPSLLAFALTAATLWAWCAGSGQKAVPLVAGQETAVPPLALPIVPTDVEVATISVRSATPRLAYLDHIKVVLTFIVVLHHSTAAFVGSGWLYGVGAYSSNFNHLFGMPLLTINQSYFMVLFFFISGYFTPGSFDRKGARAFLKDKLQRLGSPFVVYFFLISPAIDAGITLAVDQRDQVAYRPNAGPCWYIAWLLIFNVCYATLQGTFARISRPTTTVFCGAALTLGLLQAATIAVVPGGLAFMPITIGSLPLDIAAFAAGVLAQRAGWLELQSPWQVRLLAAIGSAATWAGVAWVGCCLHLAPYEPTSGDIESGEEDQGSGDGGSGTTGGFASVLGLLPWWAFASFVSAMGVLCVLLCVAILDTFARFLATESTVMRWLGRAAYTTYIIHPCVLVPLTYVWTLMLHTMWGVELSYPESSRFSPTPMPSEGIHWLGWAVVSAFTQIIVWPLAALLCRLPLLRNIL